MRRLLPQLGPQSLDKLAAALDSGRLGLPIRRADLTRHVPPAHRAAAAAALDALLRDGSVTSAAEGATILRFLAAERRETQQVRDHVELVWSGPEVMGEAASRTDRVVARLLTSATHSVLLTSYNLDRPDNSQRLFAPLARSMEKFPALKVRLCLHIPWSKAWERHPDPVQAGCAEFAAAFRGRHWPGDRLPEIYCDPRSLKPFRRGEHRPVQHSKCIVVDDRLALVTSANFSESAHHRNIEAGVLFDDPVVAVRLREQFELLMQHGHLRRL